MTTTERDLRANVGLSAAGLYDRLTDGLRESFRLEELLLRAAARLPGTVPSDAEL